MTVCVGLWCVGLSQAKHRASAKATRVDADGFQLVSGKRRRRRGQGDDGSMTAGEKRRRKKGPMELANFYRFQLRESKRDRTYTAGCFVCSLRH